MDYGHIHIDNKTLLKIIQLLVHRERLFALI